MKIPLPDRSTNVFRYFLRTTRSLDFMSTKVLPQLSERQSSNKRVKQLKYHQNDWSKRTHDLKTSPLSVVSSFSRHSNELGIYPGLI